MSRIQWRRAAAATGLAVLMTAGCGREDEPTGLGGERAVATSGTDVTVTRRGCLRRNQSTTELFLLWRGADPQVDEADNSRPLNRTRLAVSAAPKLDDSVGREVTLRGRVRGWDLRADADVLTVESIVDVGEVCADDVTLAR